MSQRSVRMLFKVGDNVSAKLAGRNYQGVVLRINKNKQYEVKFDSGNVETFAPRDVTKPVAEKPKRPSSKRSSSRGRKQSRSRSRSRSRTPGRTKSRAESKSPRVSRKTNSLPTKTSAKPRSSPRLNNLNKNKASEGVKEEYQPILQKYEIPAKTVEIMAHPNPPGPPALVNLSWMNILGASLLTVLSPALVFWVNMACDRNQCATNILPQFPSATLEYFDFQSVLIYTAWLGFQILLMFLPFGRVKEGQALRDGSRLEYRLNGFHAFVITTAVVLGLAYYRFPIKIIFDKYVQLVVISTVFSFGISLWLLIGSSSAPDVTCVAPLTPPNAIYDFYMGRVLNPLVGEFNIKFFILRRPGLLAWAALNMCMLCSEYAESKFTYSSIWFVGVSQLLYIMDTFLFEESYLSTWNITTEGLGFMLVFGNLTFIPFMFTLPVRYLLIYRPTISPLFLGFIILVPFLVGCFIYRGSNKMKDDYRRNPYHAKFNNCRTIQTNTTHRILVDGFWCWCRHPNYLGDLLIALSWCLPCGFSHAIPHFYFLYLLLFFMHRSRRDDRQCAWKYGNAWQEYCDLVRYRIIPNVY